eukprot:683814-Amphidinium_carterae.1
MPGISLGEYSTDARERAQAERPYCMQTIPSITHTQSLYASKLPEGSSCFHSLSLCCILDSPCKGSEAPYRNDTADQQQLAHIMEIPHDAQSQANERRCRSEGRWQVFSKSHTNSAPRFSWLAPWNSQRPVHTHEATRCIVCMCLIQLCTFEGAVAQAWKPWQATTTKRRC